MIIIITIIIIYVIVKEYKKRIKENDDCLKNIHNMYQLKNVSKNTEENIKELEEIVIEIDEPNNENKNNYNNQYYKKKQLLTITELKFYKVLKEITKDKNYYIFTQVVLYEIVRNKQIEGFNKIKSKSIDFVITDENSNILVCIELDDSTHYKKTRIERDIFINDLFKDLNIKLLRIPVKENYDTEKLRKKIFEE